MTTETATFAAGCFWHVQESFDKLKGVESTIVGHTGGKAENPTYQNVCSWITGHVEAVEIKFNQKIIRYKQLLDTFWKIHDSTTKDRQGLDIGRQYNSVIFYHNEEQKEIAEKSKKGVQNLTDKKIVAEIKKAQRFWKAEEYHQKYFENISLAGGRRHM